MSVTKKSAKAKSESSSSEAAMEEKKAKPAVEAASPKAAKAGAHLDRSSSSVMEGVKKAREKSKERKFEQTWTLAINLKGLDLKRPENRFNYDLPLPKGIGKQTKVAVFADVLATEAKSVTDMVITKGEIENLAADKKRLKKIVRGYDVFLAEVPLMPLIGKTLGSVLGPRGKLPRPIPPKIKLEQFLKASGNVIKVAVKESPVVHVVVGSQKMADEDVAANVEAVLNSIRDKLPKGAYNIKSAFVKLTMGPAIKVPTR